MQLLDLVNVFVASGYVPCKPLEAVLVLVSEAICIFYKHLVVVDVARALVD